MSIFGFLSLVSLEILFYSSADAKSKSNSNDHLFNITEFEILANMSTIALEESLQQVINCSSVFSIFESLQHIKICAAEEMDVSKRRKREIEEGELEVYSSDHKDDEGEIDSESYEIIDAAEDENKRTIRGIIVSHENLRPHLAWQWLEVKSIKNMPCIGACILEELQLLNTTGMPNRPVILKRITDAVNNITTERAETLIDSCVRQYDKNVEKIQPNKSDSEDLKCKAEVKFGVCLSKKTYEFCRRDTLALTAVKAVVDS